MEKCQVSCQLIIFSISNSIDNKWGIKINQWREAQVMKKLATLNGLYLSFFVSLKTSNTPYKKAPWLSLLDLTLQLELT